MTDASGKTTLKEIIGAMLFASNKPLSTSDIRKIFTETAANEEEETCREMARVKESDIAGALEHLKMELIQQSQGVTLIEVAGGFRLQTDPKCSPWLRQLLNSGKPSKLSKPALETLAIIAYRQPITRSEIEAVRGVNVDNMVRHLMECQLIKIAGRSSLPGHPLLYGTSQLFLEHFGLQSIDHLPGIEQLRRKDEERMRERSKSQTEKPPQDDDDDDGDDDNDDNDDEDDDDREPGQSTSIPEPRNDLDNTAKTASPPEEPKPDKDIEK